MPVSGERHTSSLDAADRSRVASWIYAVAAGAALACSLAALSLLLLPLVLVLLMVLFDTTAHGVLVLLGLLLGWLRGFIPYAAGTGGGADFHPLDIALRALLRALPVIGGLLSIATGRQPLRWRVALLLWAVAAACDGLVVASVLGPAIAGAATCSLPISRSGR